MASAESTNDFFLLALTGVPEAEIAASKQIPVEVVRRAIEDEVARRVDTSDFHNFDDALDYLRLGRLQKGLWTSAAKGGVGETRQVLGLIEQRNDLKKSTKQDRSLNEAVRDMLSANNVDLNDEEQDDE